ncbi:MAG: AarF/ABC1/UbiB kinase family protein, partial [Pseudorhodoplanes sp.]
IGSASIAQVHRATSRGGAQLAIKIQRPGIAAKLEADMRALRRLAAVIDRLGLLPGVPLQEMAAEFAAFTRRELDFVREGSTALRLRNQRTPNETVPRIHWPLTTSRILAMDFIPGLSIAQAAQLQAAGRHDAIAAQLPGFSLDTTLHNFATASLHQLFGTGFFHADPHPGNILLMADNRIAFIDFGIFGSISRDKRDLLMTYAESAAIGDIDSAWRAFARLAAPTDRTDMPAYRRATMAHLTRWYRNSLEPGAAQPHIGELVGQMTDIMRRHHVRIDLETLLFWRAVIALDSSALTLCPQFDLAGEMRLYFAATQMQPAQRVLKAMTDRRRIASIVRLADMMPRATSSLTALATMERQLDIAEQMPVAQRRAEHRMAQLAICAMVVIAVSIASTP